MKKIISYLAIAVFAVIVFFTTNSVSQSQTVKLANLATLNVANAECPPYTTSGGRCLTSTQTCVFSAGDTGCSP
jgi:hypothetical protein